MVIEKFSRKLFCSLKCKNYFNRNKKENKKIGYCKQCLKQFLHYPSQNRLYCSKKCKNLFTKKFANKICKTCNKTYSEKPSRINEFFCSRKCFFISNRVEKTCITCFKKFIVKKSNSYIVRCGRKCQFIDQSNGKIKIHLNGRTGYRIDLECKNYFKSSLEADFARFLRFFNIKYKFESKTFLTKEGAYTPDFFLPELNLFVELKGVEKTQNPFNVLMTKNLDKQKYIPKKYKIITITQEEFISGLKKANLWDKIPNLEQKNYRKTKRLIIKHENKKNNTTPSRTRN
jgi:hypothetical protein